MTKPGLMPRKVMLFVWWDWKRIVHYELLLLDQTINFNSTQQLERLHQVIEKQLELINRKGIVFHHNARLHTSSAIYQKLRKLGWF